MPFRKCAPLRARICGISGRIVGSEKYAFISYRRYQELRSHYQSLENKT
jgi:hypothetical protein